MPQRVYVIGMYICVFGVGAELKWMDLRDKCVQLVVADERVRVDKRRCVCKCLAVCEVRQDPRQRDRERGKQTEDRKRKTRLNG